MNPSSLKDTLSLNTMPDSIPAQTGALLSPNRIESVFGNIKGYVIDEPTPVTTLSLIIKAGSRYEEGPTIGVSHFLKRLAFHSNEKKYYYNMIRDLDVKGITFASYNTKEYIGYTTTGPRTEQDKMAEVLGAVYQPRLEEWEVENVRKEISSEIASSSVKNVLIDAIHREAFRDHGLANSINLPSYQLDKITPIEIFQFVNAFYKNDRMSLFGSGISALELQNLDDHFKPFDREKVFKVVKNPNKFPHLSTLPYIKEDKPIYNGGSEIRIPYNGSSHVMIAAEGVSKDEDISLQISALLLQHIIGASDYNLQGYIPTYPRTSRLGKEAKSSEWLISSQALSFSYSGVGLFTIYAEALPGNVSRLSSLLSKQLSSLPIITDQEVERARLQLKQSLLYNISNNSFALSDFYASQIVHDNSKVPITLLDYLSEIDKVQTATVASLAKRIVSSKLNVAAFGDITGLSKF